MDTKYLNFMALAGLGFDFDAFGQEGERELKTKHGLDKLQLVIKFMSITESDPNKVKDNFNRFKSFLVSQIKRGISPEEELNLVQGILNYVRSEPSTDERMNAMNYIFNAEFLNA